MSGFNMDGYVDVAARMAILRERYPEASLRPANPLEPFQVVVVGGKTYVAYVAACYRTPDDPCPGIGAAWEPVPGPTPYTKDSELQNAETSAWGRAIVAALVADTKKGIASADEIRNRQYEANAAPLPTTGEPTKGDYATWTVRDLAAECSVRGLESGGSKAALAARLDADDAQREFVG